VRIGVGGRGGAPGGRAGWLERRSRGEGGSAAPQLWRVRDFDDRMRGSAGEVTCQVPATHGFGGLDEAIVGVHRAVHEERLGILLVISRVFLPFRERENAYRALYGLIRNLGEKKRVRKSSGEVGDVRTQGAPFPDRDEPKTRQHV